MPGSAKNDGSNGDVPCFDVNTIRSMAGETTFARGVGYHADGRVEITEIDAKRVLANVQGTEVYCSELTIHAGEIDGDCTCPAYAEMGFCKHLVATALAANSLTTDQRQNVVSRQSLIRDHLRSQSAEALCEIIMRHAARDPALMRTLDLAVAAGETDDEKLYRRFSAAFAEAMHTDEYVDYGEVRSWARGVREVLDQAESLIGSGRAEVVRRMLDDFFVRMDEALPRIDDSSGYAGAVYSRACDIHVRACEAAKPDPVLLAKELFERETDSEWDFFYGASGPYAAALGEAGLAEYRRLAEEAWRKIEPRRGGGRSFDGLSAGRFRLQSILERFAEQDGDLDARIALRAKDLSSPYAYLGIAKLCLSHGRDAEALKWAEEGLWQFEDNPDQRLVVFTADLYRQEGRLGDASKILWRHFERSPSLELYERLKLAAGDDAGAKPALADRTSSLLEAKVVASGRPKSSSWRPEADLLIEFLILEERSAAAWRIVDAHGCGDRMLQDLAAASEETHPAEALKAYVGLVERHIQQMGQTAYKAACRIIERIRLIRERHSEGTVHAAFIDDLLIRHKAKRSFIKLLREQVGGETPR